MNLAVWIPYGILNVIMLSFFFSKTKTEMQANLRNRVAVATTLATIYLAHNGYFGG
jgi:hypothetical protein